jgi:hypothetical protein
MVDLGLEPSLHSTFRKIVNVWFNICIFGSKYNQNLDKKLIPEGFSQFKKHPEIVLYLHNTKNFKNPYNIGFKEIKLENIQVLLEARHMGFSVLFLYQHKKGEGLTLIREVDRSEYPDLKKFPIITFTEMKTSYLEFSFSTIFDNKKRISSGTKIHSGFNPTLWKTLKKRDSSITKTSVMTSQLQIRFPGISIFNNLLVITYSNNNKIIFRITKGK